MMCLVCLKYTETGYSMDDSSRKHLCSKRDGGRDFLERVQRVLMVQGNFRREVEPKPDEQGGMFLYCQTVREELRCIRQPHTL